MPDRAGKPVCTNCGEVSSRHGPNAECPPAPRAGINACRYCGIQPGQELPRPSYHEMRQDIEALSTALNATVEQYHEALDLLADVAESGIEFDDERIGYVVAQVDRRTWNEVVSRTAETREKRAAESAPIGPET
jgi:hypothetical protein